ncbi:solute carrier organic anion transporter family member 5A1-like [Lingula anatina]|uniref:Solute carrier organic anion transporter family member 5A1-like n=1 Tax=Lingula anatina TaxID=7574 RepID=A0A1S3H9L4_LINAN|nr:solute carrier organic anion transporter family member 5A1-like [Lingula anatina]|eukprot:XP_013382692.2 solute carrier organic anion transporter family member 5A1-like [Lingula anatina]
MTKSYIISDQLSVDENKVERLSRPSSVHVTQDRCGVGVLQCCANVKMFTTNFALIMLTHSIIYTYLSSVITTIEKRFGLNSTQTGLLASVYEIGSIVSIIVGTYLLSRVHVPRYISIATVIAAIGALGMAVPHFAYGSGVTEFVDNNSTQQTTFALCGNSSNKSSMAFLMFILFQLLNALGFAPAYPLGVTYIDENVPNTHTAAYSSIVFGVNIIGPVIGFVLGAVTLAYYVDFLEGFSLPRSHPQFIGAWWLGFVIIAGLSLLSAPSMALFPRHMPSRKHTDKEDGTAKEKSFAKLVKEFPRSVKRLFTTPPFLCVTLGICCELWMVGGYMIFLPKYLETQFKAPAFLATLITAFVAAVASVLGILLGGFLGSKFKFHSLQHARMLLFCSVHIKHCFNLLLKSCIIFCTEFPRSVKRLFTTPPFLCVTLGICCELWMVGGYMIFLPKYLETQFKAPAFLATLITAFVAAVASVLGILLGGFLGSKFKFHSLQHARMLLFCSVVSTLLFVALFFLGCPSLDIKGLEGNNSLSACGTTCNCATSDFSLVCGADNATYLSACYAGCAAADKKDDSTVFEDCSCISGTNQTAVLGGCDTGCNMLWQFSGVVFMFAFIAAMSSPSAIVITLRSVPKDFRAFAYGMNEAIEGVLGTL